MDFLDVTDSAIWVRLRADRLKEFNDNYRLYIAYLTANGILQVDKGYIVGEQTKGYRISPKYYGGDPIEIPVVDYVIKKRARDYKQSQLNAISHDPNYNHLGKWFNSRLTIDRDGGTEEVNKIFPLFAGNKESGVYGKLRLQGTSGRYKALRAIKRISNQEFYCKVDPNIGRFHSILTNMRKPLRKYLRYNGEVLINLDITNSQPLLSGILLSRGFYKPKKGQLSIYNYNTLSNLITFQQLNKCSREVNSSIMLGETDETLCCIDFCKYLELTQSGHFYEKVGEVLFPNQNVPRDEIKELTYIMFFSDNRHGPSQRKMEQPFINEFPNVYKIFAILKRHNKAVLSHILQRTESLIVIESATRRIARERPQLPIFTIHDSIATTVGNEDYVENILKEEIKKVTGLNATIGREVWS